MIKCKEIDDFLKSAKASKEVKDAWKKHLVEVNALEIDAQNFRKIEYYIYCMNEELFFEEKDKVLTKVDAA